MIRFRDFWSLRHSAGGHPITRRISQRLGALIAFAALRAGLSPSALTLLGACVFALSCLFFALASTDWLATLTCIALLQLAYALDCADGQLARATNRAAPFGAWLDLACDHIRNILLAVSVAYWLTRTGAPGHDLAAQGAAALLLIGMTVQLHTVTFMRQARPGTHKGQGEHGRTREFATSFIDTAAFLLIIGLLRPYAPLLLLYVALMGLAYLGLGVLRPVRQLDHAGSSK